jgi:hypothetical protein
MPEYESTGRAAGSLHQLGLRALVHRAGEAPGGAALATAARLTFDELACVLVPLIGQIGMDALVGRAVHLARREYPWLADSGTVEGADGPFVRVSKSLEHQDSALAIRAAAAVLAHFTGLLVTMIGESLAVRLMRQAWPDSFSDAADRRQCE